MLGRDAQVVRECDGCTTLANARRPKEKESAGEGQRRELLELPHGGRLAEDFGERSRAIAFRQRGRHSFRSRLNWFSSSSCSRQSRTASSSASRYSTPRV